MGRVMMLLFGSALLILSAVMAMQTREFIRTAHSIEGRVGLGDVTTQGRKALRKYVEFWVENKDYRPPRDPSLYAGLSPETVMMITKSHTRYRFATYSPMIGTQISRERIPILYNLQSLDRAQGNNLYKELDSSQAMVNTFTSLCAYSIMLFIPGALFITGCFYGLLKDRYMGLRYFRQEKQVTLDTGGWTKCPGCKVRFSTKDPNRWNHERHTSCGQRIKLV